jgi:hypothetical protein
MFMPAPRRTQKSDKTPPPAIAPETCHLKRLSFLRNARVISALLSPLVVLRRAQGKVAPIWFNSALQAILSAP